MVTCAIATRRAFGHRASLTRRRWRGASMPEDTTRSTTCARYRVDRSRRNKHGALLDAELLTAVSVELTTTHQAALQLEPLASGPSNIQTIVRARPKPLPPRLTAEDLTAHRAFVATLGSDAISLDYFTIRSVAAWMDTHPGDSRSAPSSMAQAKPSIVRCTDVGARLALLKVCSAVQYIFCTATNCEISMSAFCGPGNIVLVRRIAPLLNYQNNRGRFRC